MQRKKVVAVLGIGTNIGDKINNLFDAIERVKLSYINVVSQSKIYQTPPWGFKSTEDFLNMTVKIETQLSPLQLLIEIKAIELQMGRPFKTSTDYTSRIIDIDIIDYNNETYSSPELEIPHPCLRQRNFVLIPLKDIMPEYQYPKTKENIDVLIAEVMNETITVVNI